MIPHGVVKRLPNKFQLGIRKFLPRIPIPIALPHKICWVATHPGGLDLSVVNIERAERRFISKFLNPGATVIDAGAHHGLYTTLMSKLVGRSGRVIAFEPSPRERIGLERHLRLNSCRNVIVAPLAIGSFQGTAEFFVVDGIRSGASSLRQLVLDGRFSSERIFVPVTTLDKYLEERGIDHVDFVKMDIEGAELDAFKGGERLLRGDVKPTLMVEMSDIVTAYWGYPANQKYDLLRAWGYEWFAVAEDGTLAPSPRRDRYERFDNLVAMPAVEQPTT